MSIFGVVPEATSEWYPEIAPRPSSQKKERVSGNDRSAAMDEFLTAASGDRDHDDTPDHEASIVPIFMYDSVILGHNSSRRSTEARTRRSPWR